MSGLSTKFNFEICAPAVEITVTCGRESRSLQPALVSARAAYASWCSHRVYEYVVVCYLFLSWRGISESTTVVVEVMVEYNIDDSDKPPSSLFGNSRVNKA